MAIDPDLLERVRALAAHRGCSVSALLSEVLSGLVAGDARYTLARARALALFSRPLSLGGLALGRERLHERRRLR